MQRKYVRQQRWDGRQGIRVSTSSLQTVFRRETLIWIDLLNKVSTPHSRSNISNSSTCSFSSSHVNLFVWNAFDTIAHLLERGVTICFASTSNEDPIIVTAASLASVNNLTLQLSRSAKEDFLLFLLSCFCTFLIV